MLAQPVRALRNAAMNHLVLRSCVHICPDGREEAPELLTRIPPFVEQGQLELRSGARVSATNFARRSLSAP
jgi:hypothetical protein